ncbi:hypothetical protein HY946_00820 [Candidatus Gottesmanbacteria bacterium]|nr:hypothetical protein [Candidatus Gottesmanbacteria bacterium]
MITILHGDDIVKSRQELETIKKQYPNAEIIFLDGRKLDLTSVKQALESSSMFSRSRLVIIENFLASKKNKNQEEILGYLAKEPSETELIFWESVSLTSPGLARLKGARVLEFKPEAVLFKFLESIRPANTEETLVLLGRCIRGGPPEIIFYMLVRQFRLLLLVKDGITSGVEELDRLADWQKQRLVRQAKCFDLKQLVDIYHQLLEIDSQQKTGENAFDLPKTLELFVANL